MAQTQVPEAIAAELQRGEQAKANGNLGRARVCARRAVGMAIREYYARSQPGLDPPSAYKSILTMLADEKAPQDVKDRLGAFSQRLAKDSPEGQSYWPLEVELLDEARRIISRLMI